MPVLGSASHKALFDVLVERFSLNELEVLLWLRLGGLELETITARDALPIVAKRIVTYADRRGFIPHLVAAVRDARPDDRRVAMLAEQELDTAVPCGVAELQQLLAPQVPLLDPLPWLADAQRAAEKVCFIELPLSEDAKIAGTGFLVGEDLVLTAYHVIKAAADFQAGKPGGTVVDPAVVKFRFDYIRARDGKPILPGVEYGLAPGNWLVAWEPESAVDRQPEPKTALPSQDELDFALVRLDRPAGSHSVGADTYVPPMPKREWVRFPTAAVQYFPEGPLLIYHHPLSWSLKLSIEMRSIIGLNDNGTRLRHKTNTHGASSGSPCFDAGWNLIGLHHATQSSSESTYNQAVPIVAIAAELQRRSIRAGAA